MACKVSIFSKGQQAENVSATRLCKITYLLWRLTDILHFSILTIFYDYYLFDFNRFHFLMKRIKMQLWFSFGQIYLQCCQLLLTIYRLELEKKSAKSAIWGFKNRQKIGPIFAKISLTFWPPLPVLLHFYVTIFPKKKMFEYFSLWKKIVT